VIPIFSEVFLQITLMCIYVVAVAEQNLYSLVCQLDSVKKNMLLASSFTVFLLAVGWEFTASETISYTKVWNGAKDTAVLLVTCYVLSPCFKSIMSNSADDSCMIAMMGLILLYIFTYDYESVFKKGEKEALNRPQIKESSLSLFIVTLVMMLMCSRMQHTFQSLTIIKVTVV